MSVFVVVAVTVVVIVLGAAGVAVLQVKRMVGTLSATLQGVAERLEPLVEELRAEAAVADVELEQLRARLDAVRDQAGRAASQTGSEADHR